MSDGPFFRLVPCGVAHSVTRCISPPVSFGMCGNPKGSKSIPGVKAGFGFKKTGEPQVSKNSSESGISAFRQWIWAPSASWDSNRLAALVRIVFRVIYITLHNYHKDLVMLRAAALTYTVILSIVPLLALGTAVLKGLGAGDQIKEAAYTFIANFETSITGEYQPIPMTEVKKSGPVKGGQEGDVAPGEDAERSTENTVRDNAKGSKGNVSQNSMLLHLRQAVDQVFDYVDKTNFATIGIIGIIGLLVIVIALLNSIEEAINAIWKPVRTRPFGRRFMDYAALLIIFPLAVNIGFAAIAAIQSQAFLEMAVRWFPFKVFIILIFRVLPVFMVIATFTLLYRFLPNTRVETTAAVTGGIVGGMVWLLVQVIYLKLQLGVARYNAIYGSFATFPLVLMWIYMGWLAFLTGAEVSFAVQMWKRFRLDHSTESLADQMAAALDVAAGIFRFFRKGRPAGIREIAEETGVYGPDAYQAVMRLKSAGIIREVKDHGTHDEYLFVPSAPSDVLSPARVMVSVYGTPKTQSWGGRLTAKGLARAQQEVADEDWPEGC